MYQAIGKNKDKNLEHTVYISGPYLEEVFKWIAKPKMGGHTKLVLNPVPTSTIPIQQDRHPRTTQWSVSEVVFMKKRNVSVSDWENHRHEIDLGELNITAELAYHGLDVYKCISYGHDGSPRLIKDFMVPQPVVARESSHTPLAFIKVNTISPPHVPAVVKELHPFAGSVLEVAAWKKRATTLVVPHTPPRKQCKTKPGSSSSNPTKKARRSLASTSADFQPSVTSFFQPQPSSSTTVIDIIQQQAASSSEIIVPRDDQVSDIVLQLEESHGGQDEQTTEEEKKEDETKEEEEAT